MIETLVDIPNGNQSFRFLHRSIDWHLFTLYDENIGLKRVTVRVISDTHREKLCFTHLSTRMAAWLLLTFFMCFTQSVKFYTFHYHVLRVQMLFEKYDSSNRQRKWMVAPFSKFYGKIWAGFCLNAGKCFFLEVSV